jgi:asparagine synthase (glutamine-hydrolysing)
VTLAGFYNCSGAPARELGIAHRLGRGQSEVLERGPVGIAWDPGAPVSYAEWDGLTVVFLGRIYDAPGLTPDLVENARGPAELVARAYRRFGVQALSKLRARFAVVLWDRERDRGILANDPLTMQAWFVYRGSGWLAFGSELQDLVGILPSRPAPDPGMVAHYLGSNGGVPTGKTLFEGVTRLRPGQFIELEERCETKRYWTPKYRGTTKGTREEHAAGLRDVIERAVRRRMSETSTGVVLSGGLDSSIVTAAAAHLKPPDSALETYSSVFPEDPEIDEGWKVRSLTSSLAIEPSAFVLEPRGAVWLGLNHARDWAMPLTGVGALIDMPMAAEAVRDGVEFLLDGQGGDEVFGFAPYLVADRLRHGRLLGALELTRRWPMGRPIEPWERKYAFKHLGLKGAMPYGYEDLRTAAGPAWMLPDARARYVELADAWEWKNASSGPRWWRYLRDQMVEMPHRVFRMEYLRNRASAVGTTSESPLYDFDLVNYSLSLPPELAFKRDHSRPLAREAMQGLMPDDVRLDGVKSNLSMFCFDVLTGADAPAIERLLLDPDAELGAYVDLEHVRRRWLGQPERGLESTVAWGSQVWLWAGLECWLRAQADPDFIDEMLQRPDVAAPAMRPAAPSGTGTFSRLAGAEDRVYRWGTVSRPFQERYV